MNAAEVLNRILTDPQFADEKKELLSRLDEGRRQLDAGEYFEYDEAGLRRLFEELKNRSKRASEDEHYSTNNPNS